MVSFSADYRRREIDRKLAWALEHRERFPVDLNRAPREALLRVPGVGAATADWILAVRRERPIAAADVRRLPVNWYQLRYFVATSDHAPRRFVPGPAEYSEKCEQERLSQLELFEARAVRQ
jgi:predicted DNA-binding helix-hairpin-helix protein